MDLTACRLGRQIGRKIFDELDRVGGGKNL